MSDTQKIPLRTEVAAADQWDLTPFFADDAAWERQFAETDAKLSGYDAFRGHLLDSPGNLARGLDLHLGISRDLDNLYTYAHLKSDEDKANSHYLGLLDRAMGLFTRISEAASFIDPEIQALDAARADEFLTHEALKPYAFFLEKILRATPHTHGEEIERILAMASEVARAPSQIFSQLDNADLTFGVISDEKGQSMELSHGNFISFLMKPQPEIRRTAFDQYYQTYQAHKHGIAAALAHSVKKDLFYARVRKHASCRSAALFPDNVPETVYDNLVATVKANTAPLFRYLALRKKALGLDELHFYDTYVPLVSTIDFRLTYPEAVEIAVSALAPLGEAYTTILRDGLTSGWVDRYENKGKRSGAYSSGSYDSPPYILLNFENDNINSLYTLVHEAGHSMHSYLSKKHQLCGPPVHHLRCRGGLHLQRSATQPIPVEPIPHGQGNDRLPSQPRDRQHARHLFPPDHVRRVRGPDPPGGGAAAPLDRGHAHRHLSRPAGGVFRGIPGPRPGAGSGVSADPSLL